MNQRPSIRARRTSRAVFSAIAAVVLGAGILAPVGAMAATGRAAQSVAVADRMTGDEVLLPNEQLTAANGTKRLVMQGDGNAVVYTRSGQVLWNSHTSTSGSRLVMQGDGNLVMYTPSGAAAWNSGTANNPGAFAVMQGDGNLVIYAGGVARWNSMADRPAPAPAPVASDTLASNAQLGAGGSISNGSNSAVLQSDGNFVVYSSGRASFSTRTNNGARLVMQGDGNAVLYTSGGRAVWNSGTGGNSGARMVIQGDGNLVIYSSGGRALWNSRAASQPAPAPAPAPAPGTYYANCDAVRAAGAAPLYRGQPGYRPGLDRDGNGIACE